MSQFKNNFINRFFPASIPNIASYRGAWYLWNCISCTTGFIAKKHTSTKNKFWLNVNPFTITKGKYNWMNFLSQNNYNFIDSEVLAKELKIFFDFYRRNYPKHNYFAILFKIQLPNGHIRSCSSTQIADLTGFDKLMSNFSYIFIVDDFFNEVSEDDEEILKNYNSPTGTIIFSFKPLITIQGTKYENFFVLKENKKLKFHEGKDFNKDFNFKGFILPSSMDLQNWPNIIFSPDKKSAVATVNFKNNYQLDFFFNDINDNGYSVNVKDKNEFIFKITDTKCKESNEGFISDFKRVIVKDNVEKNYYIQNGKVVLYKEDLKNISYIEPILKQPFHKPKILTLDFETRDVKTVDPDTGRDIIVKVPICMCIYDGQKSFYYLFENPNNWIKDLRKAFIKSIMCKKYDYYKVYVHNLSYFDSVFMIDVLSQLGDVKPLKRDNAILRLLFKFKINNNKKAYTMTFYDSKLILPASLRDLSNSFNVENKKDYFPYGFLNSEDLNIDYKGPVPKFEYFLNSFGQDEYEAKKEYNLYCDRYKTKPWYLRRELYLYCKSDCVALHQIMVKFHKNIHDLFGIDITKYPTLPSITFAAYKANFMESGKIPKILSKLHYTLKQSYFGGFTESYVPTGNNINSYDVNSLYPFSMRNNPMPVGKPKYFSGNIWSIDKNAFGFFKVKVFAPLDLNKPTLPFRIKTSEGGQRTIYPVGSWTGWYFSEEIRDKLQDGYKFELLEGYLFEKSNIFKEYIDILYKIKSTTDSSDSLYYIAKLLMNSLYGRFGLNPEARECFIVTHEESERIISEKSNVIVIPLLGGKVMVSYDIENVEEINITDISVSISSAIAAYSRIEMSKYIRKYNNNIHYIDTDGIKVDCELDPSEIDSKELGKMKFEYTLLEAVFPAAKVYGGLLKKAYKKYKHWIVKLKGLKNPISYAHLKLMNNKYNILELAQEKWIRSIGKSAIIVEPTTHKLSLKDTKREMIFNSWGDFIGTIPFCLNNGVLEKRNPDTLYYLSAPKDKNEKDKKHLDELSTIDLNELYAIDFDSDYVPMESEDWLDYTPQQETFIDKVEDLKTESNDLKWLSEFDDRDQAEEIKAIEDEELKILKTMNLDDYLNKP